MTCHTNAPAPGWFRFSVRSAVCARTLTRHVHGRIELDDFGPLRLRIVEITILAQPRDAFINVRLGRATAFQQTLTKFGDRSRFGGEQLTGALEHSLAGFHRIERGLFLFAPF